MRLLAIHLPFRKDDGGGGVGSDGSGPTSSAVHVDTIIGGIKPWKDYDGKDKGKGRRKGKKVKNHVELLPVRLDFDPDQPRDDQGRWAPEEDGEGPHEIKGELTSHVINHFVFSDGDTWKSVLENYDFDHPKMKAMQADILHNGIKNPIPVDYSQIPPKVLDGHTRLAMAQRNGMKQVPTVNWDEFDYHSIHPYGEVQKDFNPDESRDNHGEWTAGAGSMSSAASPASLTMAPAHLFAKARSTALATFFSDPRPSLSRPGGELRGNSRDRHVRTAKLLSKFGDGQHCACVYCGRVLDANTLTQDKIYTADEGGRYKMANLLPACFDCNSHRNDTPLDAGVFSGPASTPFSPHTQPLLVSAAD